MTLFVSRAPTLVYRFTSNLAEWGCLDSAGDRRYNVSPRRAPRVLLITSSRFVAQREYSARITLCQSCQRSEQIMTEVGGTQLNREERPKHSNKQKMEGKDSQNKVKITWKAVVAVALVMASLVAMSTAVSAGFVEFIFGEEYEVAEATSDVEWYIPPLFEEKNHNGVTIYEAGAILPANTTYGYKVSFTFSGGKASSFTHYTNHSSHFSNPHTHSFDWIWRNNRWVWEPIGH